VSTQRGRSRSGLTGLVDLPNLGSGVKFHADIYRWQKRLDGGTRPRRGRGGGVFAAVRWVFSSGTGLCSGNVPFADWPAPDAWKGQAGTILVQVTSSKTISYPILVTAYSIDFDVDKTDEPKVTLAYSITGTPTYTGWTGTQPAATDPTKVDQEQYEGTNKTSDPNGLQSAAVRVTDIWGTLADTDAGEYAKLAAVISAAQAPFAGMKLRTATLARDAVDGGTVTEQWGLTDTAEDVINEASTVSIDPHGLASGATTANFNATPAAPATAPYSAGSWVNRGETTKEYNDGKTLHTIQWGERSTQSDVEMPLSPTDNDPYDLADTAAVCKVTTSSTPPTVPAAPLGQHVQTETVQLDDGHWRHTFTYSNLNSEQRIQFPEEVREDDTSDLQDTDRRSIVNDSSDLSAVTPPDTRLAGTVLRSVKSTRVGGTPEKWLHVWEYGPRTTEQDVTFPGTVTDNEISDVADEATVTLVTASSTAPATPAAPVGQLLSVRSEQLTAAGKWKHTFAFGNTTALQKIQFPTDTVETDPNGLASEDHQSATTGTSTPPTTPATRVTGLVLREISSVRIAGTPEKWLHRWSFGERSTVEDITFPGTVTEDEVSDIADDAVITLVTASATPPAAPAAPVGQLLSRASEQLTDAGKWKHVFKYGNTTALQRIQFPTDVQESDPSELQDEDHQSDTTDTSTPPTTPDPRITGLVLRSTSSVRIAGTPEKWLHRWTFGRRSTEQDVTFPGTVTSDEVSDIADEATVTLVTSSGTPPTTPAAPVGQLLTITSEQLTDAGKWRHTFKYGNTTALQRIQFPTDVLDTDPSALRDEDTQSDVGSTSTPPAAPATRVSGLVLRRVVTTRISGTPTKWLYRWFFGRTSTVEDVTFPGTVTTNEVSDVADEATVTQVTASSTPPTTPAAPVGQLLEVRSEQLTDAGKWKHTFRYGNTTELQKITFPTDVLRTDPSGLEDEDMQSQTAATSTLPTTPSTRITGCVLRETISLRIAGTPQLWLHRWKFGRRSTAEDITFPGTVKTADQSDIEDSATVTLISPSAVQPTTPATPLGKLVSIVSEPLTDAGKWKWTYRYANSSPKDKIEFEGSVYNSDPDQPTTTYGQGLEDTQKIRQVLDSGAPLDVADWPAPRQFWLKVRRYTIQQLGSVPAKWIHEWFFTLHTAKEEALFAGTVTTNEASQLAQAATVTVFSESATPPTTPAAPLGQWLRTETIQVWAGDDAGIPIGQWKHTFHYGNTTEAQKLIFSEDSKGDDASDLNDRDVQSQVTTSATPPAAPGTRIAGLVLRRTTTRQVGGTPAEYQHTWEYARTTAAEDLTFPGTVKRADVSNLASEATVTLLNSSSTPPATPTAPLGLLVSTASEQLTDAGQWKHTFTFRNISEQQRRTFAETETTADMVGLIDIKDVQSQVDTSATPGTAPTPNPSTLVLRRTVTKPIGGTPAQYQHTWFFGLQSTAADVLLPKYEDANDPQDLDDEQQIAAMWTGTSAAPADPTVSSGYKITLRTDLYVNATQKVRVFKLARVDSKDKLLNPKIETVDDANDIEDRAVRTQLWAVGGTAPATPSDTPANNVKLLNITDVPVNPQQNLRVWVYGAQDSADKLLLGSPWPRHRYETVTDASSLNSTAIRACLNGSTNPTTVTDANGNTLVKTRTYDHPMSFGLGTNRTLTIQEYALATPQQEMEFAATIGDSLQEGMENQTASLVACAGTATALAESVMGANQGDETVTSVRVRKVTPTLALQTINVRTDNKLLHSWSNYVVRHAVRGLPQGAVTSTSPLAYGPSGVSTGSSGAYVLIYFNGGALIALPIEIDRARSRFLYRRIWPVDTTSAVGPPAIDAWTDKLFLAVKGSVNNATFLGHSTGEVMYLGPAATFSFYRSGKRRMAVDYEFETDNWKHFIDGFLPSGSTSVTSGSITGSGLYLAGQLDAQYGVGFPPQADFSGFTAP
jgi:hypothetical protein